ncbi:methyltransferase domain-containing protein [Cytophagaceae bacterium ABcell3]|nr:methyltransferase domain-containing protein [Cytophagaceae bacterium ABcell3]
MIEAKTDIRKARLLEIGPLDNPTYLKSEANIKYLDYTSETILSAKSKNNPRYALERLVKVDFISPTPAYSEVINEKFDVVIANHVIEHIPDTISWLQEIEKILETNGILFLSVPDKRYTFDITRRNTTFIDLLYNYNNKVKKPSFYNILEHFFYHKAVDAKMVWRNEHLQKIQQQRFSPQEALKVAQRLSKEEYADVHCHVYTMDSFKELVSVLTEMNYIPLQLEEVFDTQPMTNEFQAVFRKF